MRKALQVAGLLALAVASACRRAPRERVVEWTAIGTEPFWSVEVASDGIVWRRPNVPPVVVPPISASPVRPKDANPRDTTAIVARVWRSRRSSGEPMLELVVRNGPCRDGMSDRSYPASAEVRWRDSTWVGCALRGRPSPAEAAGTTPPAGGN